MQFTLALLSFTLSAAWQHPAGMITDGTIAEIREKIATESWARDVYATHQRAVQPWVDLPSDELRRIFPTEGGNVYHNFSCPKDRVSLNFDPFNPDAFQCGTCKQTFAPEVDSGVYTPSDRYHGDLYDGWVCLFHITLTQRMVEMALIGRMEADSRLLDRATELLLLYAERMRSMPWRPGKDLSPDMPTFRQYGSIFTYHREGDNKILFDLAQTYELLRDRMTPDERAMVEVNAIQRMLDDVMFEPVYIYDHNNVYQWHRTILQAALALEREDLIDWSFGYGAFSREALPEHRSMNRILATHFNPDGAFWELASGYHLYPVNHLCEYAVLSRHVSQMDPVRFPADQYDLTVRESTGGKVIQNALTWFLSMAMPDRTMTIIGDSTKARSGMENYVSTAEVGYRYFDIKAVGDYPRYREGARSWDGLLYGAPAIVQHDQPFTSANLSSGWVSLRNEWKGNRVWAGLNALIKGGGHQHADHLGLTHFAHGELLALEKSVPYNEQSLRELGTRTFAHNTVTVDSQSGPQGEDLTPEQTPVIAYFHAGPIVQFAEAHGDKLYPQVPVYRRSVAVVEDIIFDCFRVEGGEIHDWIVNHAGPTPTISLPVESGAFTPETWIAGGSGNVLAATSNEVWTAQWPVNGVTSRLTMLGAPSTRVFALETYPLDNAVITPAFPPTQTLCVRRQDHAPFLAVWDSWKETPNLQSVEAALNRSDALRLTTVEHTYHMAFGPGLAEFGDGVRIESDAAFTLVRDRDALTLVHGTALTIRGAEGTTTLRLGAPTTISIVRQAGEPEVRIEGDISYDTIGGEDCPRPVPDVTYTIEGNWLGGNDPAAHAALAVPTAG
ncbi:MAG: heparinase II/III family protein [Candidatus Hydrogenedentes bacterium]|nr:heparinase II/III family protein [Candidatus Hydrogenedentota bacterium]